MVKVVTLFAYAERDSAQIFSLWIPYSQEKLGRRIRRP